MERPVLTIVIGFIMVLGAAILSWLIVLKYIPSTILFDLFVFAMSIGGLVTGIVGAASYVKLKKDRERKE